MTLLSTYNQFDIAFPKGKGIELWDESGKRYLDFASGIAVTNLGHQHPALISAAQEQLKQPWHVSNLYQIRQQQQLADYLVNDCVQQTGGVFFGNSGTEALEGLIKSARKFGHQNPNSAGVARTEIITFQQSFHGRSLAPLAAAAKTEHSTGFGPHLTGFKQVPFNDLEAVKSAITKETVAILVEPVQGEGGVRVADKKFLIGLSQLATEQQLLLLFDEVQVGIGRCGDIMGWRAIAPEITPDGIAWAKGLGGGIPIGAFWLTAKTAFYQDFAAVMSPGSHGSTYGGNPFSTGIALACIQTIQQQKLAENANKQGILLRQLLADLPPEIIREVRGLGLLVGIQLHEHSCWQEKPAAATLCKLLLAKGLLTVPASDNVLRLLPPLIVDEKDIKEACLLISEVLHSLCSASKPEQ